ncbi:BatD family protein [Desulfomarina sp.]
MRLGKLIIFIQLTVLLAMLPTPVFAKITAKAFLDSTTFPVNGGALLTITINGARSADIDLPEVRGVRFHNRGQSSQISIINGSYTSSITNTYLVEPLNPGKYSIPPISVTAGDTTVHTNRLEFEVTAGTGSPAPSSSPSSIEQQVAFIRLIQPPGSHYTGEIIPVKIEVCFNSDYRVNINSLPVLHGDGVVMPPLDDKPRRHRENIGGKTYNILSWNAAVTGIKAGRHSISFSLDGTLVLPGQRRPMSSFGDIFNDPFFNSFFGGTVEKPIKINSKKVDLEIIDLPEKGKPEIFTGAIGNFAMNINGAPLKAEVGEPITLTIEIQGKGNFDRVEPPVFPGNSDWKTYSPTTDFIPGKDVLSGIKRYEMAIVARNSDIKEIPSLSFCFFNPERQQYETVNSPPLTVEITPSPDRPVRSQPEEKKPVQSKKPKNKKVLMSLLHLEKGAFHYAIAPLYRKPWFIIVGGCSMVLLIMITTFRIIQQNRKNNPRRQKEKENRERFSRNLKKLEQAKKDGDNVLFLSLCRRTIQEHLGPAWGIAPSALTLADIQKRIDRPGPLMEIFTVAEEAGYGGKSIGRQQMDEYLEQLRHELEDLL